MDAGAQDFFRFRDIRIGKLREGKSRLHAYTPAHMRPALSTPRGSKPSRTRLVSAASAGSSGPKTSILARTAIGARMSVAWPPAAAIVEDTSAAPASSDAGNAAQTRPPAQS